MNSPISLATAIKCTGCSACEDICPKHCITMRNVDSLHLTPVINQEACIQCGSCMKVCPSLNPSERKIGNQSYYMAWHIDDKERMSSTSGGVGSALISYAINKGWYVSGAVMDESFILSHIVTNDANDAIKIKGSKYLQSNVEGVYKRIKDLVLSGNNVLFIGTPCQVEAIKNYIPDSLKESVLTCGIICHGVNSPLVWNDYKVWLEKKHHSKLIDYNFRSKSHGWQKKKGGPNLRVCYKLKSGKIVDRPAWNNLFHWWFGHHYILRPSCLSCVYRKEERNSDITIGDFWGIDKIDKNVDTIKGVSVIISSTERGEEFVKDCDCIELKSVEKEKAVNVLRGFTENKTEVQRDTEINNELEFERKYLSLGFDKMRRDYPAQTYLKRIVSSIKSKLG